MKKLSWSATLSLLKLAKKLEYKARRLERCGVKILDFENSQMDIVNLILRENGIGRSDEEVDWICNPIFQMLVDEISIDTCMNQLQERFYELRKKKATELRTV